MTTFDHFTGFIRNRIPGQLIIQITDKCNGLCPQCGMRAAETYPRSTLSTDPDYIRFPCRGGLDYFFINAEKGDTYPCGYRSNENLGPYWNLHYKELDRRRECYLCDWECFQDPSEFFGFPLLSIQSPFRFFKKIVRDREFVRCWLSDAAYYKECEFFDGRKAPRYERLGPCAFRLPTDRRIGQILQRLQLVH